MKLFYCFFCLFFPVLFISCENNEIVQTGTIGEIEQPSLLSFQFKAKDNPHQLISDVDCEIVCDSIVKCWIPYLLPDKKLVACFTTSDADVFFDDILFESGNVYDYCRPVSLNVVNENGSHSYTVFVHSFTGLPVVWIETEGRADIVSKDEYLEASFIMKEDVVTKGAGDVIKEKVKIKGRGNNTWEDQPKKPYRLKFDKKIPLFNQVADKSWVLLANYFDKSQLRTLVAFYLSSISRLDYTPSSHFVELFLNGRYNGTYQLTDKVKLSKGRVNSDFLLEVDRHATEESDSRYFTTRHLEFPVNIKDPDVEYDDEQFLYVKQFVNEAEEVLFSDDFMKPETGWRHYLDCNSFVDWYIIAEMAQNAETIWMLCNMSLKRGDKLKMGPVWDFDKSFGNYYNPNFLGIESTEGFWVRYSQWYARLFQDPSFEAEVRNRVHFFYERRYDILSVVNEYAEYLRYSARENDNRWDIFYHPDYYNPNDYDIWGSYENEVQYLKSFISGRLEWLHSVYSIDQD